MCARWRKPRYIASRCPSFGSLECVRIERRFISPSVCMVLIRIHQEITSGWPAGNSQDVHHVTIFLSAIQSCFSHYPTCWKRSYIRISNQIDGQFLPGYNCFASSNLLIIRADLVGVPIAPIYPFSPSSPKFLLFQTYAHILRETIQFDHSSWCFRLKHELLLPIESFVAGLLISPSRIGKIRCRLRR